MYVIHYINIYLLYNETDFEKQEMSSKITNRNHLQTKINNHIIKNYKIRTIATLLQ